MAITNITDLLTFHEGFKSKPYIDTIGKTTIGIGRNLTNNGLSHDEVLYLFNNDLIRVEAELIKNKPFFSWLDEVRKTVMIDMCFQMGLPRFLKFDKTLKLIEAKDYVGASIEMLDSDWGRKYVDRSTRLSLMMKTGQWPNV